MKVKWIGLTGGIATGKSTVAMILRDLGLPVVDADHLAREVVRPGTEALQKVSEHFGPGVLTEGGQLDRKKLGKIIFNQPNERAWLESVLHPKIQAMRSQERRSLEQMGMEMAFYDVPLLFEKNMEEEFDATILIYANENLQRERLQDRDHLSDEDINNRLKAQMSIEEKKKRADYVVINESSLSQLKLNLQTIVEDIRRNEF